ncbi:hypothetical protein AB0O76_31975 [Streptomyces sp. NPDC086554]|uniref:hypothetical protein n=1 Tax=Streptomyces sp. NPDC086554 TaxID=3154864 RepID=UPI003423A6DA
MGKETRARRAKQLSKWAALPVGVLASGAMVFSATNATIHANAFNHDNKIASGTWSGYKVTTSKPGKAVVNMDNMVRGQSGDARVTYTFDRDPDSRDKLVGNVILSQFTAKDANGKRIKDLANSELAKHVNLSFSATGLTKPVTHTVAEWYKLRKRDGFGPALVSSLPVDHSDTKSQVHVMWSLSKDAPLDARNSSLGFSLGGELESTK